MQLNAHSGALKKDCEMMVHTLFANIARILVIPRLIVFNYPEEMADKGLQDHQLMKFLLRCQGVPILSITFELDTVVNALDELDIPSQR